MVGRRNTERSKRTTPVKYMYHSVSYTGRHRPKKEYRIVKLQIETITYTGLAYHKTSP